MDEGRFLTFKMSETTRNQIRALPQEMQLKFFWAVTDFGLDGIEPNFDGIELAVWIPMRDLILNSKRQDEAWHNKQQKNGKKGGRPRKTPVDEETQNNPNNSGFFEENPNNPGFSDENPKTHNDNNNDNEKEKEKEKGKGKEDENPFSLPDELHPHQKNAVFRVERHRKFWEECGLPPAQIITNAYALNDLKDALSTFSDAKIAEAIKNFAGLVLRSGFDESVFPGGRMPSGFKNFLARWVDKFIDEAEPFERFMTKAEREQKAGKDYFDKIFNEIEEENEHG
jgi:hypothetical protein